MIAQDAFKKAMDMNVYLMGKLDELQQINNQQQQQLYYNQSLAANPDRLNF